MIIVVSISCAFFIYWYQQREARRSVQRRAQRGRIMEEEAAGHLIRSGYGIIERHPKIRYVWYLDDEPVETCVEADYLVEREGETWLVEVKTGDAARATRRETRRQLLEYAQYGEASGVLFFDADQGLIQRVEFPQTNETQRCRIPSIWLVWSWILVLIGTIWCFWH